MLGSYDFLTQAGYIPIFTEAYAEAMKANARIFGVYDKLYRTATSDELSVSSGYMLSAHPMAPWEGSSDDDTDMGDVGHAVKKRLYQTTATVPVTELLGPNGEAAFKTAMASVAERAARFKMDLINDLILTNGTCADGTAYFANAHNVGTGDNLGAVNFNAGAGYAATLATFLGFTDDKGLTMGLEPDVALFPSGLISAARTYFNPNQIWMYQDTGTASGGLLVAPYMSVGMITSTYANTVPATGGDQTNPPWYLFATQMSSAKPFVIFETGAPKVYVLGPDSEYAKDRNRVKIICKWIGLADYGPWWTAYRCN